MNRISRKQNLEERMITTAKKNRFYRATSPELILSKTDDMSLYAIRDEIAWEILKTLYASALILQRIGLKNFDNDRALRTAIKFIEMASTDKFWKAINFAIDTKEFKTIQELKEEIKKLKTQLNEAKEKMKELQEAVPKKKKGRKSFEHPLQKGEPIEISKVEWQ